MGNTSVIVSASPSSIDLYVVLRPLLKDEIPKLARVIPDHLTEGQLRNRWSEQEMGYREVLVADAGGELLGTVSIRQSIGAPSSMHLFALEVAMHRRGKGIGSAIIRQVIEESRRRGCRRVYLEVRTDNPARRLYHRLGFRRVGHAFVNAWWQFAQDGSRERVEEMSYRMVKRI